MIDTPLGNRLQIGIFGKRNVGKSSFINALTKQNISIVSEVAGTTTDPVGKAMEISGLGPVYIYDTAGLDDAGELGAKRVEKTKAIIKKVNLAVVVTTYDGFNKIDEEIIKEMLNIRIPVIVLFNKIDAHPEKLEITDKIKNFAGVKYMAISSITGFNIDAARKIIVETGAGVSIEKETLIGDLIKPGDLVVLVVPIDTGAPKGRLILPQVQVLRDTLDNGAVAVTVRESELKVALKNMQTPALVICDSQVVLETANGLPDNVNFTTFSIVFSRQKGDLAEYVKGAAAIDTLQNGDKVLILEACTHHAMTDDIGRIKLPRWIKKYTGKDIIFEINAGPYVSKKFSDYKLIIVCGGCMINRMEMLARTNDAKALHIPITNYGVAISHVQGVLKRALSPFPRERALLDK